MHDALNAISYVGGLIIGLLFIFAVIIAIFLLLIAVFVDRVALKLNKEEEDFIDEYQ